MLDIHLTYTMGDDPVILINSFDASDQSSTHSDMRVHTQEVVTNNDHYHSKSNHNSPHSENSNHTHNQSPNRSQATRRPRASTAYHYSPQHAIDSDDSQSDDSDTSPKNSEQSHSQSDNSVSPSRIISPDVDDNDIDYNAPLPDVMHKDLHPMESDIDVDPSMRRVKVYSLNEIGHWEDRGTGQISVQNANDISMIFTVKSEHIPSESDGPSAENSDHHSGIVPDVLLRHRVIDGLDYQQQGDTIITWCDQGTSNDVALSFENESGCNQVWSLIMNLQQTYSESDLVCADHSYLEPEEEALLSLPIPSKENLTEIAGRLGALTPPHKDFVASSLLTQQQQYVPQLWSLHTQFESIYEDPSSSTAQRSQALQALDTLFIVFKNLFLLNDSAFIEYLVSNEHILATVAALEYDHAYSHPSDDNDMLFPTQSNPPVDSLPSDHDYHIHRNALKAPRFLSFDSLQSCDSSLCDKIRQSYHLTYVKDVLLLRHLDDAVMSTMQSMLFLNAVHVIQKLNETRVWITSLFNSLRAVDQSSEIGNAQIKHGFSFLQELLTLAKIVQVPLRDSFYRALIEAGLIDVIESAMKSLYSRGRLFDERPSHHHVASEFILTEADKEREKEQKSDMWLWIACTDMLTSLLMHDASHLRAHLLRQKSPFDQSTVHSTGSTHANQITGLLSVLVATLCHAKLYLGMGHTISCVIRLMLDPEMSGASPSHPPLSPTSPGEMDITQTQFLDYVYDSFMGHLVCALPVLPKSKARRNIPFYLQRQFHIIELLSFCVSQHPPQFLTLVTRTQLFQKMAGLWRGLQDTNRSDLRCSVVRFLRICLATKEHVFMEGMINSDLLRLLMDCFLSSQRYNILNSALMDLWLLMKNEHIVVCMDWVSEHFGAQLESISYVDFFSTWRQDWEKACLSSTQTSPSHLQHDGAYGGDNVMRSLDQLDDEDANMDLYESNHSSSSDEAETCEKTEPLSYNDERDRGVFTSPVQHDSDSDDETTLVTHHSNNTRAVERTADDGEHLNHESSSPAGSLPGSPVSSTAGSKPQQTKRRSIHLDDGATPLSIIITRSPILTTSKPGSPPLLVQPTSPRSPTHHILRSRSPPPPPLNAALSAVKKSSSWGSNSPELKARTLSPAGLEPLDSHPKPHHASPQRRSHPGSILEALTDEDSADRKRRKTASV